MKTLLALLACVLLLAGCAAPRTERPASPYSFSKPPYVHPKVVEDLMTWLSDGGDQVIAINLSESQHSNRYSGEVKVKKLEGFAVPYVYVTDGEEEFGYQYVGTLTSGIDVLYTSSSGGGSGIFIDLLLVRWEEDVGIDCDWEDLVVRPDRRRLLLRKVGEFGLGDRWDGTLEVRGNEILVGKDRGWFTYSGGKGGGHLSYDVRDRVLRVNLDPAPYERMRAAARSRPDARFVHIGHLDTAEGRYEIGVERLVSRDDARLFLFTPEGRLAAEYACDSVRRGPSFWCYDGALYLYDGTIAGIPVEPEIADDVTSSRRIVDFSNGIASARIRREKEAVTMPVGFP